MTHPANSSLGALRSGAAAVIIGGGPGGTAAAIALKKGAQALGITIDITLVEGKLFSNGQHHNQCAGVLSPPIAQILENELGIPFPWHLSQRSINRYVLHTARKSIELDGAGEASYAMRRIQFDEYMLETARQMGIQIVQARVTDLEVHADRVVIYTESCCLVADVVIGAFGMDEGTAEAFTRAVGYKAPPSLSTVVTKFHPGEDQVENFGDSIHVFLPNSPKIEFGAFTPKGNHLTINIAGKAIDANLMDAFFALPEVSQILKSLTNTDHLDSRMISYFKGRFPRGLAKNYYGDRFILVGDAAGLVRAFKGKGVTSAIQTGMRAADVILHKGISTTAFQAYDEANHDILEDMPYSQAMRYLTIFASSLGLMDVAIRAAEKNPGLRLALFDAVSAHRSYKEVVGHILTPSAVGSILQAFFTRDPGKPKAAVGDG